MGIYCKHDSLIVKYQGKNWKISTYEKEGGDIGESCDYYKFAADFTVDMKTLITRQWGTVEKCAKYLIDRQRFLPTGSKTDPFTDSVRGLKIEEYKESIFNEFGEIAP